MGAMDHDAECQMSHSIDARCSVAGDNQPHLVHAHCNSDTLIGYRGTLGLDSVLQACSVQFPFATDAF